MDVLAHNSVYRRATLISCRMDGKHRSREGMPDVKPHGLTHRDCLIRAGSMGKLTVGFRSDETPEAGVSLLGITDI